MTSKISDKLAKLVEKGAPSISLQILVSRDNEDNIAVVVRRLYELGIDRFELLKHSDIIIANVSYESIKPLSNLPVVQWLDVESSASEAELLD